MLIQDQEEVPDGEPLNENGEPLRDQEELDRSTYRTYCDKLRKLDPTNPALDTVGPVNSSPTAADIKRVESALAEVRARQTTVDTTKTPQIDPLDPLGTHTELRSGAETFLPPAAEKIISSSRPDLEKQVLLDGSLQRVKSGGMPAANADFDSMQPQDVKTYPSNTRVGVLEEGTQVVVRAKSQPTVEINTLSGLCYVIRWSVIDGMLKGKAVTEHTTRSHNISALKEMFVIDPGLTAFLKGEVISARQWSALIFEQNLRGSAPQAIAAACSVVGYLEAVCMDIDYNVYETFNIKLDVAGLHKARRGFHTPSYAIIEADERFIIVSDADYYWAIAGERPFVESIFGANPKHILDDFEEGIAPYKHSREPVRTRIWYNLSSYLGVCRSSFVEL